MIVAHDLTKSYGTELVLHEVTFTVNAGERIGLIGPNGSGKSTILRLLAGEESVDRGHVVLDPPDLRIGYLPQGFAS
jgi:ATPase subunit of ABC transporter with duplicated ATPase domains